MTISFWLRDIVAFGLQTAGVIAVGAALACALRIREPRTAAVYWRVLLVVCLLLPFCQTWKVTAPPVVQSLAVSSSSAGPAPTPTSAARDGVETRQTDTWLLLLLAGGLGARGLWVLVGAWTLRRLRKSAVLLDPLPAPIREVQQRLGVRAGFRLSDRIAGPVTFGARRPVILLPPAVLGMGPHVQEAIAYHELIHVRRRDWLQEILEEAVRTVLWFHPAVHWLIGRIQLSREQLVDRAVIGLTGSRERYIEALVTVALGESSMSLAPAPLFLRRRVLKKRVAQILEEATMSTRRLIASVSLSAVALVCTAIVGIRAFPLQAQAPAQERTGAPVEIVSGADHLLHGALPEYPRRAIEQRIEGDVVLDLTVDARGEVADARVLSGPDELRRAALQSVLQWHYSPDALRSTSTQATLRFHVPADANVTYGDRGFAFKRQAGKADLNDLSPAQRVERDLAKIEEALQNSATSADQRVELEHKLVAEQMLLEKIRRDRQMVEMENATKEKMTPQQNELDRMREEIMEKMIAERGQLERKRMIEGTARIAQIRTERASQEEIKELVARAGIEIGEPFTEETAKRIVEAAAGIDEHLQVSFRPDGSGGIIVTLVGPDNKDIR